MDALNPGVVDVFLAGVSQIQGDRSGPTGRVLNLKNGVVTHYNPGQSIPSRIKVQQRNGFRSLTVSGHSATTGATSNPSWSNPELLSTLGDQLLSIASAIPRVYDGTDWTHYATERVVTNILSQSVFHTSQHTISAQDEAKIGGVTCCVWNERFDPETTSQVLFIGFKSSDGAWIRTPQVLYDPGADGGIPFGKTIADSQGSYFWVAFKALGAFSADVFTVQLYDLNGKLVDSVNTTRIQDVYSARSFWDITQLHGGGCYLAQPLHTVASNTDGVSFTSFTQTAGVIGSITATNPDIHCRGPLAWITNDLGNSRYYLAVIGQGEEESGKLWGYEISPPSPNPFTHEYDFEVEPAVDTIVDSLIGFVTANNNPDNFDNTPDMTVSFTSLHTADSAASSGPPFDPQLRYSECWTCDISDAVTFNRQNDYTCQVSRAFKHDGEYYSVNYYQSGSGNTIRSTSLEVEFADGDYMIGAQLQPIKVTSGVDFTSGAPKTFPEPANRGTIQVTGSFSSHNVLTADTVANVLSGSDLFNQLIATGTPLLKWTFANLTVGNYTGARLVVAGSSIPDADGTWDIVGFDPGDTHVVYTLPSNVAGGSVATGTFGTAGTFQINSMTNYRIFDLGTAYDVRTAALLVGGTAVVTDNGTPGNNGTKTIARANPNFAPYVAPYLGGIWVATTTESTSSGTFTAVLNPAQPSVWSFDAETFDDSLLIGPHTLIVNGSAFTLPGTPNSGPIDVNNDSTGEGYSITDSPSQHTIETDGNAFVAEYFFSPKPFPTVSVRVPDDVTPYTFFLQNVTPDYTYQNARVIVTNDSLHTSNNGVYQVTGFDASAHLLFCVPIDGNKDQRSQLFLPDDQVITILFETNVQPEFQPCWLMVPLTGTKPVVGRWEYGLAYADWRYEGTTTPNLFPGAVTSPVIDSDGLSIILPYRAVSFTVGQSVAVNSGQVVNAAIASNQSTIGIKQFILSDSTGVATGSSDQMMLPGPMCGQFTSSGFTENGVNFGFEAPYLISQQENAGVAALRVGGSYQVQVIAEVQEENGDRVFSIVSPPLNFTLSGSNNSATYGIRMMQPLDSDGNPVAKHFGVTNRRLVGISIYRTSYLNNAPTDELHKITLDLNVNGLAPVSDTNASGFTFLDDFTATYKDENLDAAIISNEVMYTNKGFLPRFPAPANRNGDFWKQRTWLVGYDGAIWMSGEKQEGDSTWFFPNWRIVLPTTDKPVACAEMDDYLVIGCEKSMWYIPAGNLPEANGREGQLPTPVQLPFSNGCTGHMITLREGVAYSSTDGGVWLITRGLTNFWLSQAKQDSIGTLPITSMAIDKRQRLCVSVGTGTVFVYDQTVKTWYDWIVPASDVHFLATFQGEAAFQEDNRVWVYDPSIYYDNFDGSKVGIPIDLTLSSFQFGNVRGLKSCWAMQIVGDYKGEHHINAVLSYPDDDPGNPTVFPDPDDGPYTPDPSLPYLLEINPMIEQASSFGLRIFTDFSGITNPGNSCEIELISCEVGMDPSVGVNKFQDSRRIPGR